jgi:hypothetical protein
MRTPDKLAAVLLTAVNGFTLGDMVASAANQGRFGPQHFGPVPADGLKGFDIVAISPD